MRRTWLAAGPLVTLLTLGCAAKPRPLVAGTDACEYCRMAIADVRFGAEVAMRAGRIHTFDSIECLAAFYGSLSRTAEVRGIWVADFTTARMVPADSAVFLRSDSLRSPMGRHYAAFAPGTSASALTRRYGGDVLRWVDVVERVRAGRRDPSADMDAPPPAARRDASRSGA